MVQSIDHSLTQEPGVLGQLVRFSWQTRYGQAVQYRFSRLLFGPSGRRQTSVHKCS